MHVWQSKKWCNKHSSDVSLYFNITFRSWHSTYIILRICSGNLCSSSGFFPGDNNSDSWPHTLQEKEFVKWKGSSHQVKEIFLFNYMWNTITYTYFSFILWLVSYFRDYNSWVANMNNMKAAEAGQNNYEIKWILFFHSCSFSLF